MNSMTEKIWDYIDGTCTAEEREQISRLIVHDEEHKRIYNELLQLHSGFSELELDEPPMAFTYNVMEQIRSGQASIPLKTVVNKYLIRGIVTFFIGSILVLLIVVLSSIGHPSGQSVFQLPREINMGYPAKYFTGAWLNAFLLFDVVLGLFLFDAYLRKHRHAKQ